MQVMVLLAREERRTCAAPTTGCHYLSFRLGEALWNCPCEQELDANVELAGVMSLLYGEVRWGSQSGHGSVWHLVDGPPRVPGPRREVRDMAKLAVGTENILLAIRRRMERLLSFIIAKTSSDMTTM